MTPLLVEEAAPERKERRARFSLPPSFWRGPGAMLLAALLFAILGALVKVAARGGVPAAESIFVRFSAGLVTCLALSRAGLIRLEFRRPGLLMVRGLFGSVSALFFFLAVTSSSLGRGSLLCYTHVIFGALFSALLLRERLRPGALIALGVAVAGVVLVTRPGASGVNAGDLFGLLSGVTGAIAITAIRELRKTESAYAIFASYCVFGVVTGLAMAGGSWVVPRGSALLALAGVAAVATAGQLLMTSSYGYCSVALGGLLSLNTIVIAAAIGLVWFGERISPTTLAGSALVLGAAAYFTMLEAAPAPR
jgi:drug/metabolite transporter (DMT)-like permease